MEGEGGGSGGSRTPLLVGGLLLLLMVIGGAVAGTLLGLGVIGGEEEQTRKSENVKEGSVPVNNHLTISEESLRKEENAADAGGRERDATAMGKRNRTSVNTSSGSVGRTLEPPSSSPPSHSSSRTSTPSPSLSTPPLSPSQSLPRPPQILPADGHQQVFSKCSILMKLRFFELN